MGRGTAHFTTSATTSDKPTVAGAVTEAATGLIPFVTSAREWKKGNYFSAIGWGVLDAVGAASLIVPGLGEADEAGIAALKMAKAGAEGAEAVEAVSNATKVTEAATDGVKTVEAVTATSETVSAQAARQAEQKAAQAERQAALKEKPTTEPQMQQPQQMQQGKAPTGGTPAQTPIQAPLKPDAVMEGVKRDLESMGVRTEDIPNFIRDNGEAFSALIEKNKPSMLQAGANSFATLLNVAQKAPELMRNWSVWGRRGAYVALGGALAGAATEFMVLPIVHGVQNTFINNAKIPEAQAAAKEREAVAQAKNYNVLKSEDTAYCRFSAKDQEEWKAAKIREDGFVKVPVCAPKP